MKIDESALNELQAAYAGDTGEGALVRDILGALREAQELIEKFEYRTYSEGSCVYCLARIQEPENESHESDCPYAIRERLGYGEKEAKDGDN